MRRGRNARRRFGAWQLALLLAVGPGCALDMAQPRVRPANRDPAIRRIAWDANAEDAAPATADGDDEESDEADEPTPRRASATTSSSSARESSGRGGRFQEDTDLSRPRAQRRGEGGGPTSSEEAREEEHDPEEFRSDLLVNALGMEDSTVGIYGWVQSSFTGNPANPANGRNFGVYPNFKANRFTFQQFFLIIERPLDPEKADEYDWGFRLDQIYGLDYRQLHMVGFLDGVFPANDPGWEATQFFGEVHLPWLTSGGIDVKGGRFLSLGGYEDPYAPGRPLDSASYMFSYAQPFTEFGMMTTFHLTDNVNIYNGAVNGWDRWINQTYRWHYTGGASWDSTDGRTNAAWTFDVGPIQFPRFFPARYPFTPNGVPQPPLLAGKKNPNYPDQGFLTTFVLTHRWNDRLLTVVEADYGSDNNVPNPRGAGPIDGQWYGLAGWFLLEVNDRLTGVYRGEVFRDAGGLRTGFDNTYYEMTLGLIYKPRKWLWFRPEVREDWTTGAPAYSGKSDQLTIGFDSIFLY